MQNIKTNLTNLLTQIRACEQEFHRPANSVALLAVSKQQPIEKIQQAIAAGQRCFGESYLQEALPKILALANESIEWHFIGPLQSNKTKKIAEYFQWVHSVDSLRMAKRLNNQRPAHLPPLNICLEINVSAENTKKGVKSEDVFSLIDYCLTLPNLKLRGLMAIPLPQKTFESQCLEFQKLTSLYKNIQERGVMLDTLSMGMSNDWQAAIAAGANLLRIGTGVFGKRNHTSVAHPE